MSEISELILLLNKQHQEQNKQHREQMTMLQEQLKILQSSLNNPRENVPTPMASFQPFDSTSELWTDYLARFRTFVTANSIPDNKQAQIFLTNQSNSVYKMLSNLAAQQQPVKSIHANLAKLFLNWQAEYDKMQLHVIFNPLKIL